MPLSAFNLTLSYLTNIFTSSLGIVKVNDLMLRLDSISRLYLFVLITGF